MTKIIIIIPLFGKWLKEILPIYIRERMSGYNKNTINKHIDNECYKCCGLKKQYIELYKLDLPANVVNNIVEYHFDKDDECKKCQKWRYYQHQIDCLLNIKRVHNRDVEDDALNIFTGV